MFISRVDMGILDRRTWKNGVRNKLHGFTMSLFPEVEGSNPREKMNILWSLEKNAVGAYYLLIQSSIPPAVSGETHLFGKKRLPLSTKPLDYGWLNDSDSVSYRVHLNPVKTREKKRYPIKDSNEILGWWDDKQEELGMTPIDSLFIENNVGKVQKGGSQFHFSDAVLIGRSQVKNLSLLKKSVLYGVGKGKSYGTGLLLLGR